MNKQAKCLPLFLREKYIFNPPAKNNPFSKPRLKHILGSCRDRPTRKITLNQPPPTADVVQEIEHQFFIPCWEIWHKYCIPFKASPEK